MSATIEERILEMRFSNKDFEKNAKGTLKTLDKLKDSLNMTDQTKTLKTLQDTADSINFSRMADSLEFLEKRFSTLGIVGMKIIEDITDSMIGLVKKGVNFATDAIVSGGKKRAMNIENAHFQLQALLKDEEKVQAVMKNANDSVSGTAYAYDEAAKAASQFAASGISAGPKMEQALKGIVGVAAMTNSEYESIASIFTTVAGNGRLMGDQLLQLSSRGLNAAATLKDFFNDVNSGAVNASDEVTKMVKVITKGKTTSEQNIREWVSKGTISFDIFAEAMDQAFGESAFRANETFSGALSNVKAAFARIGAGFISPLIEQNGALVKLFNSVRLKVNDIKSTLVFDEEIGNVHALSKQFTDFAIETITAVDEFVSALDISRIMEIFYYGVESIKNVIKAAGSVLAPFGKALSETFSAPTFDDILNLADKIETFTYKMKISEETSQNLHDLFKGILDVVKLLGDGFVKLIKKIAPSNTAIKGFSGNILNAAGALGRALTNFTEWVRTSPKVKEAFELFSKYVGLGTKGIKELVEKFKEFSGPYIDRAIDKFKAIKDVIGLISFGDILDFLGELKDKLVDWIYSLKDFDISKALEAIGKLKERLFDLFSKSGNPKKLLSFIGTASDFGKNVNQAFDFDETISRVQKFKEIMTGFAEWVGKILGPLMEHLSFGNLVAAGGSLGMIYSLINVSKSFNKLANSLTALPNILGAVKSTLVQYQTNLKATILLKNAAAIGVLALALGALTFVDSSKLMSAAIALSLVSGIFLAFATKFLNAKEKTKTVNDVLYEFAEGFSKGLDRFTKSLEIKQIGKVLKDFGKTLLLIVAAIVILAVAFKKDKESMTVAIAALGAILTFMTMFMLYMALLGDHANQGGAGVKKAATGILLTAASLFIVMKAIKSLFAIEVPSDYKVKLGIMAGIFAGIGALILVVAVASKKAGEGKLRNSTLLTATIAIMGVTIALGKLFKMELPPDYKGKLLILAGVFAGMAGLIVALGYASKLAGGALKAGGTILAMTLFLITLTGALAILAAIPFNNLLRGTTALGVVLIALGLSLTGAAKVTSEQSWKTVLAMAIGMAAIVSALSILSFLDSHKLLVSAASLSAVLLSIGAAINLASKMTTKTARKAIVRTILGVIPIAAALTVLSKQPWEGMLGAAAAMSLVFLAVGKTLNIISGQEGLNVKKIGLFLLAVTGGIIPIAAALYLLSGQSWQGMLGAAAAIYLVTLEMGKTLQRISDSTNLSTSKINMFLKATLAVIPIGVALGILANQPWKGMLAAAISIGLVLKSFSLLLREISQLNGISKEKIGEFLASTLAVIPIGVALGILANQPWQGMLASAVALSAVLMAMSGAFMVISNSKDADYKKLLAYGASTLALIPIVIAISQLSSKSWDGMLAAGASLSMVLLSIAGAFAIISMSKPNMTALAAFLEGALGTLVITQALLPLVGYPAGNVLATALAIGTVLLAMSAAMAVAAVVGSVGGTAAITGLGAMGVFIAGFTGILLILGELLNNDTAKSLINGGTEILGMIAYAIGSFVGNIVGGMLAGISEGLPAIAENLSTFMYNLLPFFEYLGEVPEGALGQATALAGVIALFTAVEFLNGVASIIGVGDDLPEFGNKLSKFMYKARYFFESLGTLPEGSISAAESVASMLLNFTKAEFVQGIASIFGLDKSLSEFGSELLSFGEPLSEFAEQVKDIDSEQVEGAANAASLMSEVAKNLQGTGGILQGIIGEKSLSDFATQLNDFAPSLVNFASIVKDVKPEHVEGAAAAATIMAEMADKLPGQDGFVQLLFGQKNLSEFSKELYAFAPALLLFSRTVKNIKSEDVEGAGAAASIMAEVANNLPAQDGFAQKVFGTKSLSDFATQLKEFGPSIKSFAGSVSGIDAGVVENAASAAKILVALNDELPDSGALGGFVDWLTGKTDLKTFGEKIASFGAAIGGFYQKIYAIDVTQFETVVSEVQNLIGVISGSAKMDTSGVLAVNFAIQELGESGVQSFIDAFNNSRDKMNNTMVDVYAGAIQSLETYILKATTKKRMETLIGLFFSYILKDIENQDDSLYAKGETSATKWSEGFTSKYIEAATVAENFVKEAVKAIQKHYEDFRERGKGSADRFNVGMKGKFTEATKTAQDFIKKFMDVFEKRLEKWTEAGKDAADGFIDGIKSKYAAAAKAAEGLAEIAADAIETALDINSPSKRLFGYGSFGGEGFVLGLVDWAEAARATGDRLGESAVTGLRLAIEKTAEMFEQEEIYDPVIRPVIDLQNVTRSVNDIASMFNESLAISQINADNASMAFNEKYASRLGEEEKNTDEKQPGSITYVQNNYSPKALSPTEIYRQTVSQLAQFKEVAGVI